MQSFLSGIRKLLILAIGTSFLGCCGFSLFCNPPASEVFSKTNTAEPVVYETENVTSVIKQPTIFPTLSLNYLPTFPYVNEKTQTPTLMPLPLPTVPYVNRDIAVVSGEKVNLRSGPGTDFVVVGQKFRGESFDIFDKNEDGSWLQLDRKGNVWIASWLVVVNPTPTATPTSTPTPISSDAIIDREIVNLRDGPSTEHRVIRQLEKHTKLTITGVNSDRTWIRVRTGVYNGWVSAPLCFIRKNLANVQVINIAPPSPMPQPTNPPPKPEENSKQDPVCDCSGNYYNCANFGRHWAAQECYNYCRSIGRGDIHRLDRDNDRYACESLP